MTEEWRKWKHITKIDPDKKITARIVDKIIESKTDAIMVSGTLGISKEKVTSVLKLLKDYDIPKVLEPAGPHGMVYKGYDWLFVPSVFNTDSSVWVNGMHKAWIREHKDIINWDIVVPEALIILNPKCSAAKVTRAKIITKDEVVAAAITAERFFKFPVVYIEYSGKYGDPEIVEAVKNNLKTAHLIYGGGIRTQQQAAKMSQFATIVVGNTIYEGGLTTFLDTMRGTLAAQSKSINERMNELKVMKKKEEDRKGRLQKYKEKRSEKKAEKEAKRAERKIKKAKKKIEKEEKKIKRTRLKRTIKK
ncbi:MAG: heptaprenylglyceryl phosphate synthase [Nanoarchaeota archaeon]|nr:heptaprenylglyceryl phosphate synthase [Nanoarchaeota archaeon]